MGRVGWVGKDGAGSKAEIHTHTDISYTHQPHNTLQPYNTLLYPVLTVPLQNPYQTTATDETRRSKTG